MSFFKENRRIILDKDDLMEFLVKFSGTCLTEEEAGKISLSNCCDFIDEWVKTHCIS